jgi:hypothetical protein
MADQKLISSIFDLTKNVDKLSVDIKKNAASTSELAAAQEKSTESTKDLGKVAESIKGLDLKSLKGEFSELTKSIGGLDFKGLSGDLKALDFKGLTKDLKSLDFKGLTQGLKGLDLKGIVGGAKGLDLKGISGSLGDIGSLKDTISGSLGGLLKGGGKGILGAFAEGGDVKKTGNYLVGEKGPEVVNLKAGAAVIPNNILKARQDILKKLGSDAPSEKEISRKREELLTSDPLYYDGEPGWLEEDLNSYLEGLQGKATSEFTQEDLKKLSKPVDNKAEELVNPSSTSAKIDKKGKSEEDKAKLKEKKDGLFSKIFGKKDKDEAESGDKKSKFSDLISKGGDLLKENKDALKGKASELGLAGMSDIFKSKKDGGGPGGMLNSLKGLNKKSGEDGASGLLSSIKGLGKKSGDGESGGIKSDIVKLSKKENKSVTPGDSISSPTNQAADNKKSTTASPTITSAESSGPTTGKEKSDASAAASPMDGGQLTAADGAEIKMLLARMASALEGTLTVSSLESPFRPDSRKF